MRPATRRTATLAAQQGQRQMGQHEQVRPEEDDLISVGAEDIAQARDADQNPMDPIHHDSNLADTNGSNVDTAVVHAVVQKLIDCGLFAQNAPMVGPHINMASAPLPGTQHWPMQQCAGHYNMQQALQGPQQAQMGIHISCPQYPTGPGTTQTAAQRPAGPPQTASMLGTYPTNRQQNLPSTRGLGTTHQGLPMPGTAGLGMNMRMNMPPAPHYTHSGPWRQRSGQHWALF
jgi:hypothetical protein